MPQNRLSIEIFSAPGCNKCRRAYRLAQDVLQELDNHDIALRLVNIVEELEYAVDLGIRATPGIVFNGTLVFTAIPTEEALRKAILTHLTGGEHE